MNALQFGLPLQNRCKGVDVIDGNLCTGGHALQRAQAKLPALKEDKGIRVAGMIDYRGEKIQGNSVGFLFGSRADADTVCCQLQTQGQLGMSRQR
jgi:hypothetical protein